MTPDLSRVNTSAIKVLRVLKALRGHSLHGLSNGDLAKALGESPSTINRCLNTLMAEGLAAQLETGRFAHNVALLQIAQAHQSEMAKASARLDELTQRINRF